MARLLVTISTTIILLIAGCQPIHRAGELPPRRTPSASSAGSANSAVNSSFSIRRHTIGSSVQDRPIDAVTFEPAAFTGQTVLIFAGIHGDERATTPLARELVAFLESSREIPAGTRLVIVPCANPDGYAKSTRQNANFVDLNRNFPALNWKESPRGRYWNGPSPLSEPESRALFNLVNEIRPSRICTIHSIRRGQHGNNFDGPAESLATLMSKQNGYNVLPTIGYPTPGSFGSWAGIDQRIPTITLEIPNGIDGKQAWIENKSALLAFIRGR